MIQILLYNYQEKRKGWKMVWFFVIQKHGKLEVQKEFVAHECDDVHRAKRYLNMAKRDGFKAIPKLSSGILHIHLYKPTH